jgi:hypothetical protein
MNLYEILYKKHTQTINVKREVKYDMTIFLHTLK